MRQYLRSRGKSNHFHKIAGFLAVFPLFYIIYLTFLDTPDKLTDTPYALAPELWNRVAVCFRFPRLMAVGGIEKWFYMMRNHVLTGKLRLHSITFDYIHFGDLMQFTSSLILESLAKNYRINLDPAELQDECDVILSVGVTPPATLNSGIPSILSIRGSYTPGPIGAYVYSYAQFIRSFDAAFAVSKGSALSFHSLSLETGMPIQVISNPVIPTSPVAQIPRALYQKNFNISDDVKVLAFIARVVPTKGVQFFVKTVAFLPSGWHGLICGPLPNHHLLPPDNGRFTYVGAFTDPSYVFTILDAVDAVFLPSLSEGLPNVLIEAWQVRKPFFMRRVGLAVQHADGVFIVDSFDPIKVAKQIATSMNDEAAIESRLDYGQGVVESDFSVETVRSIYVELIANLIAQKGLLLNRNFKFKIKEQRGFVVEPVGRTLGARCHAEKVCIMSIYHRDGTPCWKAKVDALSVHRCENTTVAGVAQTQGNIIYSITCGVADQVFRMREAMHLRLFPGHAVQIDALKC